MMKNIFALTVITVLASQARAQLDNPLPGLTAEELAVFHQGKALFQHDMTVEEGLGPTFNARSCVACHFQGGVGGGEAGIANNVTHFGAQTEGRFIDLFEHGGPVLQKQSWLSEGMPEGDICGLMPDVLPVGARDLITSQRHTPPIFGFGLIDAIADKDILKREGSKGKFPGIRGVANWGVELETVRAYAGFTAIRPRTQPGGAARVGRFGWHAPTATLFQFSTEPFNIELGVGTPFFPREFHPQGTAPLPPECRLNGSQPNDTNSEMSVLLYAFQALTAPPPRGPITHDVKKGEKLFRKVGCQDCHTKSFKTVKDYYAIWPDGEAHRVEALSNKTFEPWADFLLHDMGPLLDDHRDQGRASGRLWRTTPLWGIRYRTEFLHDGSVTTLDDAIAAHGGEGQPSTNAYFALSEEEQEQVDQFLMSL